MNRDSVAAALILAVWPWIPSAASAEHTPEDVESEAAAQPIIPSMTSHQAAASEAGWQHYFQLAEKRSRRPRVALIATSTTFGVGAILTGIGVSQCHTGDAYSCNSAGKILVPFGATVAGLGAIGMITSGIILGVRNRRIRDFERNMRSRSRRGRFRWGIRSGGLVF